MGTHPIFESDFDCLTVENMLRRVINRQLIRTKSDRSHLAGVTPKLHEDRSSSLDLAGKLVYDPASGTFKTAIGGVKNGTDVTAHTGQAYDAGDFRHNRFMGGKQKQVAQMWAIDMIAEEPVIPSDARRHMCDGTHGGVAKEQGHPRVWINLDDGEVHECSYCGLRYQKRDADAVPRLEKGAHRCGPVKRLRAARLQAVLH